MSEKVSALLREGNLSDEKLNALSREELLELVRCSHADARTDFLTGVLNGRGFEERVCAYLSRAFQGASGGALAVFDVDHFKQINDEGGHEAGDRALCCVSKEISDHIRPADVFGRIGGDEFALWLPATDADNARVMAERLRNTVSSNCSIGISVGVAHTDSAGLLYGRLQRHADTALYNAKNNGRNRVAV